jgi:hypothetical protein
MSLLTKDAELINNASQKYQLHSYQAGQAAGYAILEE